MKRSLLILLVFWTFFVQSCRTAKKDWVNENFTSKSETEAFQKGIAKVTETLKKDVAESLTEFKKEVSSTATTSSSETESENTTVTGTITAEDGKEKSVTIGGTTIKSNGADVSFTTTASKEISKEFLEKFQEISSELQSEKLLRETLEAQLFSLKSEFANFRSSYESEKDTKTKTVNKKGLTGGFTFWIILAIIIIALIWYFRKSIPFI